MRSFFKWTCLMGSFVFLFFAMLQLDMVRQERQFIDKNLCCITLKDSNDFVVKLELLLDYFEHKGFENWPSTKPYQPKSGLSFNGSSYLLDFVKYGTFDCGHAAQLFNILAREHGFECQSVMDGDSRSHVISMCEQGERRVFIDPLFQHIYLNAEGKELSETQFASGWEASAMRCEDKRILLYPITSFSFRNSEIWLNRVVDFLDKIEAWDLRTFSFRSLVSSLHVFLLVLSLTITSVFFIASAFFR